MNRTKILDVIRAIDALKGRMNMVSGSNELHMLQLDMMRTYMLTKLDQEEIEVLEYVDGNKSGNVSRMEHIVNSIDYGRKSLDARQGTKGIEFVLEVFPHKGGGKEEHLLMVMPNELGRMQELEYYLEHLSSYVYILLNGEIFKGKQWQERQKEARRWEAEYNEEYWEEDY